MKTKYIIEIIKQSLFIRTLILTVFSFAQAQQKVGVAFSSYERAKQVLDTAIAAHGGLENIRAADKITINYKSVNYPLAQSKVILLPCRSRAFRGAA
jgi:trimethylamine:corrinoid methyltransferase-like protein